MHRGFGQYFWVDPRDENAGPLCIEKSSPFLPPLQPLSQMRLQKLSAFSHLSHHKFIWTFLPTLGFLAFLYKMSIGSDIIKPETFGTPVPSIHFAEFLITQINFPAWALYFLTDIYFQQDGKQQLVVITPLSCLEMFRNRAFFSPKSVIII